MASSINRADDEESDDAPYGAMARATDKIKTEVSDDGGLFDQVYKQTFGTSQASERREAHRSNDEESGGSEAESSDGDYRGNKDTMGYAVIPWWAKD